MGGGCPYKEKYIQFNFIQYISKGLKAASLEGKKESSEAKKGRMKEARKQEAKKTIY